MSPVIGSLCSGYGGLDMGVQLAIGGRVAWHVEYDRDPSAILAHHWPDIPNYGDVKTTDWSQVEPVDILTAGYPCQPFSHAGTRKGADDPRHLWPDVARAISVLRPRLVVLENVRGHVSLGLDAVTGDLSELLYDARGCVVRAADAGAPHNRARIFIVAYPQDDGRQGDERGRLAPEPARATSDQRAPTDASSRPQPGPAKLGDGLRVTAERGGVTPADAAGDGRHEGWSESARVVRRPDAAERSAAVRWGQYAPAIRRWERTLGRPAPAPTEPGSKGQPRLSPRFVEWMMGLPAGHVTDVPISRNAQLKALGNGVVPQQAALALRWLLGGEWAPVVGADGLLPTPRALGGRTSTHAATTAYRRSAPSLEQAIEIAQGIMPREIESWDQVQESWRPKIARGDGAA